MWIPIHALIGSRALSPAQLDVHLLICHAAAQKVAMQADDLDVLCTPKFIELENEGKKSTYLRIDIRPTTSAQ